MQLPLNRLPAIKLARMLRAGDVTCEAVTHSFLDAVEQRDAEVRAFAWIDAARAMNIAREFDRNGGLGPLAGLPIAVKDVIDTAGIPTECGSPIYAGRIPHADAACVTTACAAGGYVFGKTVTAELANPTPGATRNPHAPAHTPGGSSSGSAAAVAARMAPFALGTQTAGSVIRPAAFCGVVGFVPTRGAIPRSGVLQVSDTLDVIGCFAHSVEDVAFLDAVLSMRVADAAFDDATAPSIAWTDTPWAAQLTTSMAKSLGDVVRLCSDSGASVRRAMWSDMFATLVDAQRTVQVFETARAFAAETEAAGNLLSAPLAALIDEGRSIEPACYVSALASGRRCAREVNGLFGNADVVLAPSAPGEAPYGLESTGDPTFNRPWHLLGGPQINVPLPRSMTHTKSNLPLGVQLVGRPGDDARVLAAAYWLEQRLLHASN